MVSDMTTERLLGAHMSIAGGVSKCIDRGISIGCTAIQIFTGFNNRWTSKPIQNNDLLNYQRNRSRVRIIFAHNNYLINLVSNDPVKLRRSLNSMREELKRAETLKIPFLVIHPGSHMGDGEKSGMQRLAEKLNLLFDETKGSGVRVLLETSAGQGTNLGYRFEHLAEIISMINNPERIGICFDTCHVFAAGYDLRSPKLYQNTFARFDRIIGLSNIYAFHLNDSKYPLGSRKDRHEHIGRGFLGLNAFRLLLNDERFVQIPMVLETPKGTDMEEDRRNLVLLRSLIGAGPDN